MKHPITDSSRKLSTIILVSSVAMIGLLGMLYLVIWGDSLKTEVLTIIGTNIGAVATLATIALRDLSHNKDKELDVERAKSQQQTDAQTSQPTALD
jgi:hypothetical protein